MDIKKRAAAISYSKEDPAPVVTAIGEGAIAEKIIQIAAEQNIQIEKDEDIMAILQLFDAGDYIPEQLYMSFAVILSRLYSLNKSNSGV